MDFDQPRQIFSASYTHDGIETGRHELSSSLPLRPSLDQIKRLEAAIAEHEQVEMPVNHYFAAGMYGREVHIPAGTVVVGKMHRHEHLMVMTKGDATIYTDQGMERVVAPRVWVSQPGTKRVAYIHEDSTFVTFHATNETDLAKIEAEVIIPDGVLEHCADEIKEQLECLG